MQAWKLGIFYVNAADPRILVPKANGLGMTLNLGRPESWAIVVLMLLVLGAVVLRRRNRKQG